MKQDEKMTTKIYFNPKNGRLNFETPSEFKQKITDFTHSILHKFNKEPVTFNIQFSEQKTSTNTIAVDGNNNPFRDKSSKLVLRPGGHGALIKNINTLEGDIIFIKNIDNVVPDTLKEETIKFKKILGVILINIQSEVFKSLKRLTSGKMTEEEIKRITQMAKNVLNICYPDKYEKWPLEKKQHYLLENLNRPIRICGMVKNEGEPGGGPFWVRNKDNKVSLQIVETAQINKESDTQRKIFEQSTHFNPVDMVCGIRNYNGDKFNLFNYVDPDTYYISEKSMSGKTVKALELPGLWNGAMANWITIFIEVPVTTFNPVKTVNDLLKKVE